jgi:hypothetical protein
MTMHPVSFVRVAALLAAATLPLASLQAAPPAAKPVMTGLDGAEFDACGSHGQVRGLREDGDNFLSVRAAPGTAAAETDRLKNGATVILCDSSKDGKWSGVVYPAAGQTAATCATSSPVPSQTAYAGPCRSGWVASTFVAVTAG